ncbi:MAG TPA: HAD family hydrolase [Candidatus Acidoferrum sp.]|nr:HAD family hydrolase [Candidatus Acidoferrum sp.]
MNVKAILFDLHGTLVYLENPLKSEETSDFMLDHGYEVYPQSWDAACHYVGMVDYPKHGYDNRRTFLKQILKRLNVEVDSSTLEKLVQLYDCRNHYSLFPDTSTAVKEAKHFGLKTAIVTTIPDFVFSSAIKPIRDCFDVVMTGARAGCEKSNPAMHKQTLNELRVIPEEAVMIGDELLVDIMIPKKLGMCTVLLDRTHEFKKKPQEADRKANTLIEAIAFVENWHKS